MRICYTSVGTNDLEKARKFYDELFAVIGVKRQWDMDRGACWGPAKDASFAVFLPYDGKSATPGNGTMIGLMLDSNAEVEAMHSKALSLGGKCEGPPGYRTDTFYGTYFRDLDGNKLCCYYSGGHK